MCGPARGLALALSGAQQATPSGFRLPRVRDEQLVGRHTAMKRQRLATCVLTSIQNEFCRSLKLGHEREAKFDARPRRIESRSIMQLGKCQRNDNELHFSAARTWARPE